MLYCCYLSLCCCAVANPTGRILNRFSRDQNLVDEVCPATFFDFIQTTLFCFAAMALLCISLPWLLLLVPVLYYLFVTLRTKYIKSSREIKRLEAISRSPIYADFSAALDGLNTLRAYKLEKRITTSFFNQLDKNQRVWHCFLMVSRWLGFRLVSLSFFSTHKHNAHHDALRMHSPPFHLLIAHAAI